MNEPGDELTGSLRRAAEALKAPPATPLPSGFADAVARRAGRTAGPLAWLQAQLADWWRPRTVQLRPALALALALCAATGILSSWMFPWPAADGTVLVRFAVAAPAARSVAVAGDFNDWDPRSMRLQRTSDEGLWQALVPMRPGLHQYMFVIDGERWIPDPLSSETVDDGFGQRNSLMRIDATGGAGDDDDGGVSL